MSSKVKSVADEQGKPIEITDPFARRLIGKYLDNRKEDIARLTRALAASDFETIRVTGHNLYGSGAAYGLDDISWIGRSIESAADSRDVSKIEQSIGDLQVFLQKLRVR
ncbi:MAG: Hpt domain-containing protein [Gammaproteobacteria bacterium]|nr:Hpt domain-containing protein [Gammaproteobacteria bacterium]